jgi:hypothetical protein
MEHKDGLNLEPKFFTGLFLSLDKSKSKKERVVLIDKVITNSDSGRQAADRQENYFPRKLIFYRSKVAIRPELQ